MNISRLLCAAVALASSTIGLHAQSASRQWVVYEGKDGPGKGKHVVFLSGDEEYRSEQGLPQLAKILAERHGFKCTVLFSVDPKTGEIDPGTKNNEPGMEAMDTADACVMLLRFREWPDEQMKHFVDYVNAGKPIIGLRTATHAFAYSKDSTSAYAKYSWNGKGEWPGGFGKQILGETWVNHHGAHMKEATRAVVEPGAENDPLLRGVKDVFCTTDVYGVNPPADAKILLRGQVLSGMQPTDPPVDGKKNDPMQPVAWTRAWTGPSGKPSKILTTTMGAASDLVNEGLRRLIVNGVYWGVGLEVPAKADVTPVGDFKPDFYGAGKHVRNVKPADLQ